MAGRRHEGERAGVTPAIAEALAGGDSIPVRSLLCVHGAIPPGGRRSVEGVTLVTFRALEVLRPAV
jgi:hypothetical protein